LQYQISKVAEVLNVHPRTVVRILAGDVGASFTSVTSDLTTIPKLAKAFSSKPEVWAAALNGTDILITAAEASRLLRIPERTMRHWRTKEDPDYRFMPDVEGGQTIRFSRRRLMRLKLELAK
jgi:plasmid maintenance system antidote protein VapI